MYKALSVVAALVFLLSCNNSTPDAPATGDASKPADAAPPAINYSVVRSLPHDTTSFTEGLLFHNGLLYEATGTDTNMPESRRSLFGVLDTATGEIHKKVEIDRNKYFGEGIAFLNGKVYQLTYTTKVGFIYDEKTFKKLGEFTIPSQEGWGMTTNGASLIMSDGTSNLTWLDPNTLHPVKVLGVTDNNGPVSNINELELINGSIYANQWLTNYILKIDTSSGKVLGKLDLTSLVDQAHNKWEGSEALNGIAYDPANKKVYVTGKLWPEIYEIKFNW